MILVVSVSITKDKELLMIEEKRDSGINQWNFHSGRIEKNEDIMALP
ncbi:DNA mismatch repair protein MutT [Rummeliibacillus sp. TYF-LIM-RU47]|nr:DNA mismatch repair protein MutT [Rummeliibacillus sp. TYF-LIM-RU47]